MGVLNACKPRPEVLSGDLADAIFAADFGDLIAGKAPKVYKDAKTFFQNTHPAAHLKNIVEHIFERLSNAKEPGAALRLSTGFGGGKTHTLMALWHLARNITDPALGTELLPAAGRPDRVSVVAVDAAKAGTTEFAEHGATKTRSLWGEVLFQLGGKQTLKALGKADDPEASPSEAQIQAAFPPGPVLILLDELVIYMAKLSPRGQGNMLGFIRSLIDVVLKRPQTVLVLTDPAGQVAYAKEAASLATLTEAATKLSEIYGRKMSDFDPIGGESARVIARRLFERVDSASAQAASQAYNKLYQRVLEQHTGVLPPKAASAEYAKRIVECYPFHPRLLDTAQDHLGAIQNFQKSRGVLRLFARIIRDVWEANEDLELITAGEINWSSPRIQADLLSRLGRDNFKAVVSADIEKHAKELDGGSKHGVHRRVASALLLESLPLTPNSGFEPRDLTLATLRLDEAGPEPSEALGRLSGVCWHLYPMPGGRGWQFRYEPNIIKQIEERKAQVPVEDAKSRVLAEAQGYFSGPAFKVVAWPTSARRVPESAELQLVLCEDEKTAERVCAYSDDSDPKAPIPRRFQNAIVAITATSDSLSRAIDAAQRLLAAENIEKDPGTKGDAGKLVRDQLNRVKPSLEKTFRIQTCRAFDRVVLASGAVHQIEEQFQVPDEQILQRAHGQACLRKFLEGKGMIYQHGDALDVNRFLKDVLPGATTLKDNPEVFTAKAVHERFLSAPGLRLIPDGSVVRQTILKAVADGKVVVRLPDGRAYDAKGCVEGPEGKRRRIPGALTTLALDDTVWVTPAKSAAASLWLKEIAPGEPPGKPGKELPKPSLPARVTANTWEDMQKYAGERPLLELHLIATKPAAASRLLTLAQPLSADSLTLTVSVSGQVKDGGTVNFLASDIKPSHHMKPLSIAQTIFNSLSEGAEYNADLTLSFGPSGRLGLEDQLRQLAKDAPEEVTTTATFDKPVGGSQ